MLARMCRHHFLEVCGLLLMILTMICCVDAAERPHIIFIMADDMGWNDVSFHGSDQIPTPNIDALAYNGIILNNHYVQSICTPSRAALMTGRYPMHTGMQGYPILAAEPRGLPEGKILPQYLKELGYVTRAIGKWHLGFHRKELTPTFRGFDSHMGYWSGFVSYYDYILQDTYTEGDFSGFDLRRNLTSAWDLVGRYATDVFTDEAVRLIQNHDVRDPLFLYMAHLAPHAGNKGKLLEAPQSVINKFHYIADPNRRSYAAMVSKLDESVGRVVQALQRRNMLQTSIIIFLSDNGAPTVGVFRNWGSNWPLRGVKETLWEGGVKGLGLIWSPILHQVPRVSHQLMHITDWLPTLYSAAGGDASQMDSTIDGVDQWESLVYNLVSRREEVLVNIDEKARNAAIRLHNWKLVVGSIRNGAFDKYFGDSGDEPFIPPYNTTAVVHSAAGVAIGKTLTSNFLRVTREEDIPHLRSAATIRCDPNSTFHTQPCNPAETGEVCLYDVENDPCERNNLARTYDHVVRHLRRLLVRHRARLVPQGNLPPDAYAADPRKWNNTWTFWTDCTFSPDANLCAATREVKRVYGLTN